MTCLMHFVLPAISFTLPLWASGNPKGDREFPVWALHRQRDLKKGDGIPEPLPSAALKPGCSSYPAGRLVETSVFHDSGVVFTAEDRGWGGGPRSALKRGAPARFCRPTSVTVAMVF